MREAALNRGNMGSNMTNGSYVIFVLPIRRLNIETQFYIISRCLYYVYLSIVMFLSKSLLNK